jgi:hypothetical protein
MWNGWIKWNHDMFGGQKCNILRNMLTASLTGGLWHCSSSGFLLSRGLGQSIWCCPQQHARKVTKRWPLKRRSIIYMVFTMILECVRVVDCVWQCVTCSWRHHDAEADGLAGVLSGPQGELLLVRIMRRIASRSVRLCAEWGDVGFQFLSLSLILYNIFATYASPCFQLLWGFNFSRFDAFFIWSAERHLWHDSAEDRERPTAPGSQRGVSAQVELTPTLCWTHRWCS